MLTVAIGSNNIVPSISNEPEELSVSKVYQFYLFSGFCEAGS